MGYLFIISCIFSFISISHACETTSRKDINEPSDSIKNTSLHRACLCNNEAIVVDLIKNGANIEAKNIWDRTPLFFACSKRTVKNLQVLLANGANVHVKDNDDEYTPLHYAVSQESFTCVKLLLEHGAEVNAKNNKGQTPREMAENIELQDQEVKDIINLLHEYELKQEPINTKD